MAFSTWPSANDKRCAGHAPAGADAAERGYFAFQARGRWFESNPGDHLPVAQWTERFTFRTRPLLGSVWRNIALKENVNIRRTPMRLNTRRTKAVRTHEGASAFVTLSAEQRLRRSVMSCLL